MDLKKMWYALSPKHSRDGARPCSSLFFFVEIGTSYFSNGKDAWVKRLRSLNDGLTGNCPRRLPKSRVRNGCLCIKLLRLRDLLVTTLKPRLAWLTEITSKKSNQRLGPVCLQNRFLHWVSGWTRTEEELKPEPSRPGTSFLCAESHFTTGFLPWFRIGAS